MAIILSHEATMTYSNDIAQTDSLIRSFGGTWDGISAESVARLL